MSESPPPRFVHVDGRRVAYRRAGEGPAALVLHGSPQSSLAVAGMGRAAAAAGLCAVMPDTPGAGLSEPLRAERLDIDALALAARGFADAIGLGRFAIYGCHTGASVALALAALCPGRVTGIALDGVSDWTAAERAEFGDRYAPPFVPSWDGAHMAWLWARMEAQSIFFPWHAREAATWRGADLSPLEHLHRNAMDMLRSGDGYRRLYHAALAYDPARHLAAVQAPVRLMTGASDVLLGHADRPALRDLAREVFDAPADLWAACAGLLAAWGGDPAPAPPGAGRNRDGLTMDVFHGGGAALAWRGRLEGGGRPLVLLHEAGASSRRFAPLLPALAASRPVIAFDLPGHGSSDAGDLSHVAAACRALRLSDAAAAGPRFGGVAAQALAGAGGCARAADIGPRIADRVSLGARGAVSLAPEWDGAHLLRAWRVATRMALWDPWFEPSRTHVRHEFGDLDPAGVQAAAIDLLAAGPSWAAANAMEAGAEEPPAETIGAEALAGWRR